MNFRLVFFITSCLICLDGVAMALSAGVAWLMGDSPRDVQWLLGCGIAAILFGAAGIFLTYRRESVQPRFREGFAAVTLGWLMISVFGALPFVSVVGMHWYDAVFETVSGFTTTGATVIDSKLVLCDGRTLKNGIESLPSGILFWRSLTHWIGGMGIVLFALAILPMFGIAGQVLYNAEVPGIKTRSDQFTPRFASTAKILCLVYVVLTLVETVLLRVCGMPLFDAVCHSFATISTGGFSTKNDSIAHYNSYIQLVIIIFMFLAGCNFILHYRALAGLSPFRALARLLHFRVETSLPLKDYLNEEFRVFAAILGVAALIIAGYLYFSDPDSRSICRSCGCKDPAGSVQLASPGVPGDPAGGTSVSAKTVPAASDFPDDPVCDTSCPAARGLPAADVPGDPAGDTPVPAKTVPTASAVPEKPATGTGKSADSISRDVYYHNMPKSFMAALFQVVSIATTTGFATSNFDAWPAAAGMLIFGLMLMGGCGGSTSGGIKCMRIILLCKFSFSELRRNIFPHAMQNIRLNGERQAPSTLNRALGFLLIYMTTCFVFQLLLTFVWDTDMLTALSASVSSIGNVGPAFGMLAPDKTFSKVTPVAKLLLALEMLIGRLELYTVLIFFLPSFWKR